MTPKKKNILTGVLGTLLALTIVGWSAPTLFGPLVRASIGGTTALESLFVVRSGDTNPTCTTATSDGDICAADSIEANGAMDIGGALDVSGGDITLENDALLQNGTNNKVEISENSEDITFTFGTNAVTISSDTAADFTFSRAVTIDGMFDPGAVSSWVDLGEANKNFFGIQNDGTTYAEAANSLNTLYLHNGFKLNHTNVVAGGAYLLTLDATGLDLGGGTIAENDNAEVFGNLFHATGRPMVVGVDPAFQFCVSVTFADVSGSDAFYCGWREAQTVPSAIGSYTDFFAVGHVSGDFYELDEDGSTDVDYTDWADTESKDLCVLISAAGVATSTVGGAGPGTPNAQTITDGTSVVPFCNLLHDANLAENSIITSWAVSYQ